jgi:nitrate/TMAO reductase-like tetraheme cytochrome c subunit
MIVVYVLGVVAGAYGVALGILMVWGKKRMTIQRTRTEEVIVQPASSQNVLDTTTARPHYKKRNLTIEIPDLAQEPEESESRFIKKFYKVMTI